jgi:hypothetical protein
MRDGVLMLKDVEIANEPLDRLPQVNLTGWAQLVQRFDRLTGELEATDGACRNGRVCTS